MQPNIFSSIVCFIAVFEKRGGERMNRIARLFAIAIMVTIAFSSVGFAWSYYVPPEDLVVQDELVSAEVYAAGTVIAYLPNGAKSIIIEQTQYFVSGGNWFLPIANEGVQYLVVLAPV